MSSVYRVSFISFFLSWTPFISFCCAVALVETSSAVLTRSNETEYSCSWSQGRNFQLFTIQYYVSGLVIYGLIYVEVHSICTQFVENFYRFTNFVRCWFCVCWDYHEFNPSFVNVVYHIDCSVYIESSLHPKDKSHLILVSNLVVYCWIWFASILLRIFALLLGYCCLIKWIWKHSFLKYL